MHVNRLKWCLAHGKGYTSVSYYYDGNYYNVYKVPGTILDTVTSAG